MDFALWENWVKTNYKFNDMYGKINIVCLTRVLAIMLPILKLDNLHADMS